ncbi:unnamed protein product [Discosporangium mesarthrocarpum]
MEEALFLTKFASKVTVVHRRDFFRASKIMQQRVMTHPKVKVLMYRSVQRWITSGDDSTLVGAELVDPRNGTTSKLPCSGAFIAIGHKPMTAFLGQDKGDSGGVAREKREGVELDKEGFIILKEHTMTSVEGIFACGDVVDKRYRQAITAAGMGCQAAIDCERWLATQE